MSLATSMRQLQVAPGEVGITFLAQAGFLFQTSVGTRVVIDPYLSDSVERLVGFKRMSPALIRPDELDVDLFLATHAHPDHLDPDTVSALAQRPDTLFVGAPDCAEAFCSCDVPAERMKILRPGDRWTARDVVIRAVEADHGELAPDAVGYVLETEGVTIYHVGDSAYAPELICPSLGSHIDVMIAPINGAFGNLDACKACQFAALIRPRLFIACHFWMFVEHGGDPAKFLREAAALPVGVAARVMAPGECCIVKAQEAQEVMRGDIPCTHGRPLERDDHADG